MVRRAIAGFLVAVAVLLVGCSNGVALQTFSDRSGLFSFSYPSGMMQVQGARSEVGKAFLFRDLVHDDELVSLTIADYDKADRIEQLGSIETVGRRFADNVLAPAGSEREATLLNGGSIDRDGTMYYILEYAVNANGQPPPRCRGAVHPPPQALYPHSFFARRTVGDLERGILRGR